MITIRTREDLGKLDEAPVETEEVYVGRRLSSKLVVLLLSKFPNLKRIYLPRSLYERTSERLREALRRVGVELVPTNRKPGRPPKYSEETLKLVVEKYKSGEKVPEISRDLGIPVRTVYYILRRMGVR